MRLIALTTLALVAFAANSLLCRVALRDGHVDAATFASLRVVSGALVLWLVVAWRERRRDLRGDWLTAAALALYLVAFTLAYLALTAATGALILFGAAQLTMLLAGLRRGERLDLRRGIGLALAAGGLLYLLSPGLAAPPLGSALAMALAGVCWGAYSLRGRGSRTPTADTAGYLVRTAVLVLPVAALWPGPMVLDGPGLALAVASGAIATGLGYVVWYTALQGLDATGAATVQLAVPVLAAVGGVTLLGEPFTVRVAVASVAVLGGIALVTAGGRGAPPG